MGPLFDGIALPKEKPLNNQDYYTKSNPRQITVVVDEKTDYGGNECDKEKRPNEDS